MDTESEKQDQESIDLDATTTNTDTRWTYLSSAITTAVLIGFMLIVGLGAAGVLSLSLITQQWFALVALVVGMAATWLWGTDTLEAYRNSGK